MRTIVFIAFAIVGAACVAHKKPAPPAPPRPPAASIPPPVSHSFLDPETGVMLRGPNLVGPRPVYRPQAPYPSSALKAKITGEVFMTVTIDANGRVEKVVVNRSVRKDIDDAAVAAIKTWRFEPATRDGAPVRSGMIVTMGFYVR